MSKGFSNDDKRFVIVTGLSGAGKSLASNFFEDLGYFCVDNLPAPLLSRFAELVLQAESNIHKICLVIDMRGGQFIEALDQELAQLSHRGIDYSILYLEASDEVLVQRFKESRRQHPLSIDGSIIGGITKERAALAHVRELATITIDTSTLEKNDLKNKILQLWKADREDLKINIQSFGFKYGVPIDADMVMDVRFLKNPYYEPSLRALTGRDQAVREYVFDSKEAQTFMKHFSDLIKELLPQYIESGRTTFNIAIGCTGGQHRSVSVAIELANNLQKSGYSIYLNHRDH